MKERLTILAEQIADDVIEKLFTNGAGQKARRLVLELEDGRNGGGWAKKPVHDYVLEIIKKHLGEEKNNIEREARNI